MGAPYLSLSASHVANCCRNSAISTAWKQNDSIRFFTSGMIGNAAFFGLDRALFPVILRATVSLSASNTPSVVKWSKLISKNAASASFFVAYLIDIALMRKSKKSREYSALYIVSLFPCSPRRFSQCLAGVWFGDYQHPRAVLLVASHILHCVSDTSDKIP